MLITQEIQKIKNNYDKTIDIVNGLSFSQKDVKRMIEFYANSKYLNGQKDELGRDKPFNQILNAICDVEDTAKDLDTKDISTTSDDSNHYLESWLLTKDVYVWMKEVNFAKTLNDLKRIHTKYGSVLAKKVIRDENLYIEFPEWKNVITDATSVLNNPIMEVHFMTPYEISKMTEWDKTEIKKILKSLKNDLSKKIPVYEVRGYFPKSIIKELEKKKYTDEDEITFSYQLHYVAGIPTENTKDTEAFCPLYWEDNTDKVYKYLARKPRAGRSWGVGVFEEGEEAQVWTNDAVLKQHRAMEYTTKVIGQTASRKLKGRNLLSETVDGTILETEDNKPVLPLNLLPSGGLTQYNNLIAQWYDQLQKTTSAYSAQRGDVPPSGTPFRLQATVLQQSSNVFKSLQQEIGIFITEIIEDWVLPYLSKKLTREHLLSYEFSPEELKEIDRKFSLKNANSIAIGKILAGEMVTRDQYDNWINHYDEFIKITKGQRFINIPEGFYKNLKSKVTVNVTGEQRNKGATLESLNNILITYASNPSLSSDPVASQLLAKIIELSGAGISPISITGAINAKQKKDQETMQQNAQIQQGSQQVAQPKMSLTTSTK